VGSNDSADRRAAPRFEIIAQANVVSGDDIYLLAVRNISAAGAFLEGRPRDHAELVPGAEIEVTISVGTPEMGDDEVSNIECRGRVARIELRTATSPGGFGVTLEPKTDADQERLEDLLGRLIALPPAQRPASIG
jgi:PilZ domain-containing protein